MGQVNSCACDATEFSDPYSMGTLPETRSDHFDVSGAALHDIDLEDCLEVDSLPALRGLRHYLLIFVAGRQILARTAGARNAHPGHHDGHAVRNITVEPGNDRIVLARSG